MASSQGRKEIGDETVDITNIKDIDPFELEKTLSFLNIDFHQHASQKTEEFAAIRQQLGTNYNYEMRSEAKRLKSFLSYRKLSSWCPKAMASAGFYFTGLDQSVQCFCCGLVFCTTSLRTPPYEDHVKHNPACGFIQGRDVGNIPKYKVRVQPSVNDQRDVQEYTAEESRLQSFTDWPFYARIQPDKLSSAGFFFTGRRDTVQCFSCRGCLGNWEETDDAWKEHAKWFPECHYVRSKKTPEEIKQYITSYGGFSGYTGTHFNSALSGRTFPTVTRCTNLSIFEDEVVRLESFKEWPENAHANPADLAGAGFYYTGVADAVKCFTCGIHVHSFEPGDDPYSEHMKFSPGCAFLHKLTSVNDKDIQNENQLDSLLIEPLLKREEQFHSSTAPEFHSEGWIHEVKKLKHQLVDLYNSPSFSKLSPFAESSHVSIDLKSLFADISVTSKNIRDQPLEQLTLPDILSDLVDITMIEGEAGSGKTALLRKIAIIWASGCCTILSRFSLVFYISLSSTDGQPALSDIICKQLIGPTSCLSEETVLEIMKELKNQILFLVDDYGVMDSVPEAIEDLLLNNHWNGLSLAVTVQKDRGRKLRQYARTILSIQDFPLYSSIYMYRQLFSHDMSVIEGFLIELISSKTFQAALKTPIFTFALCVFTVQNLNEKISSDLSICRAYLMHNMLKHPKETEREVEALISSCGELALKCLFQSQFDFTDEDLRAACVNNDDVLKFGLLSKYTSQRLHPIYRFFHPSFQEFLAAKRISELLESENKVKNESGFSYLKQINTFLRLAGRYYFFLKYSCMLSPKTTSIIISYLFTLLNNSEAFECQADTKIHLQHHPELACMEERLTLLRSNLRNLHVPFVIQLLLDFAINASYRGKSLAECSPIILQFLKGKEITIELSSSNTLLLRFLADYPEGLSLVKSLQLSITGITEETHLNFVHSEDFASYWDVPIIDQDYSNAFQLVSDAFEKIDDYRLKRFVDISNFGFNLGYHKIALLKVEATGRIVGWENSLHNLMAFLPFTDHVELNVTKSPGFVESLRPCIEKHKEAFVMCSLHKVELNLEEQELIVQMSSLKCLQLSGMQPPEHILLHIASFKQLKELILNLSTVQEVIFPDSFGNLLNLEKLALSQVNMKAHSSRLAQFIANFPNLTSFHLNCDCFPEFDKLLEGISQNKKIQELRLHGLFLADKQIAQLASVLPFLTNLKVLDLEGQQCMDTEATKIFGQALPSLVKLEELKLPSGSAVKETATSIIQQFQYLPDLREISMDNNVLDDSSLLTLAKMARDGYMRNLQKLNLNVNHDVTQSGWRNFFQTMDNLPNLNEMCITRIYTEHYKTDPLTLIALVQCVSRLHSLNKLVMLGWLLDEKDLEMFNAMKQNHPQAKSFMLIWKWILPFSPILKE
ncbi:LOW QUALITY PROTEIN: baculoviral IAP repeat-containing protein 1 [Rhinophrynus dorsalis]